MRKLKNIFVSGILSVCMVVTSLPATLLAQEVETVQEDNDDDRQEDAQDKAQYELISFAELPESIKNQSVALGTDIEELEFPETLTASYRSFKEKPVDEKEPENNTGDKDDEKDSEDNTRDKDDEKDSEDNTGVEDDEKDPEDNTGDEGGEKNPEENTGVESGEKDPENNTGDEDRGKNPGTGDNENVPETNSEGEGNENESEDNPEVGDSSQTPDEKPETENGNQMTEGDSETKAGKSEAAPAVSETEDAGKAEPAVKEKTVEVHMKEYNSQPEDMDAPKTLISENSETGTGLSGEAEVDEDVDSDSGLSEETELESGSDADLSDETSTESDANKDKNEGNVQESSTDTVVIEEIAWISTPAYDSDVAGSYIFTPVLSEKYTLAEGVNLPEIIVTVRVDELLEEAEEPLNDVTEVPAFGTISSDTVWDSSGTLSNGELIVESGVTLTINNVINISGNVIIKGGGTIKRGSGNAYFSVFSGANFTVGEITLEGASLSSSVSMILTSNAKLTLDDGCRIRNCNKTSSHGAALHMNGGEAVLNNVTIENCSGVGWGGTITINKSVMTVNGGTYRNNKDKGNFAGSVIYNMYSKLYIYGGRFINNTASGEKLSGCIFDTGAIGSETHLYGGYFEGNKSDTKGFGKGAILFNSSYDPEHVTSGDAIIEISGDVHFCGDGVEDSGTDGFFLDFGKVPRKVSIGSPLVSPVYFYLKAQEGYVIAKGSSNGYKLTEKDMKQIHFTDVGDSGKKYYAWLNKENNEIYLSENVPPYGLYVYYSANGANGTVEDNTEYASGADVIVESAENLSMEGCTFKEWNTKPDGTGESYIPGTAFKITDDITLYAIFEDGRSLTADFYSGEANKKESITRTLAEDADSVTINAPELKDMEGWTKLGWNTVKERYTGDIPVGTQLTISENTPYYGVYKRNITLSYDANEGNSTPESESGDCFANVHEAITYKTASFNVADGISADNSDWDFVGWNTKQDGTGDLYGEGEIIEITEDTTLYATFERPPYATFYSGSAGNYEVKKTNVVTGKVIAPPLKEKEGWNEIGWDKDKAGYEGSIKAGNVLELTGNTSYYGAYEKRVTLSYDAKGGDTTPESKTQIRHAKVCEDNVIYDSGDDDHELFEFEIAPDISQDGYEFMGWNTREDGKGDFYKATDADRKRISITQNTTLYAIFKSPLTATFYSGRAGESESRTAVLSGTAGSGTITAPELKEMAEDGWIKVGWDAEEEGYSGNIDAGSEITLSEDTSFYGVYKKDIGLSYDGNGWGTAPEEQNGIIYANVHDSISYKSAQFAVAPAITRAGYTFLGWSLNRDGIDPSGFNYYRPEDIISAMDSVTLYAQMVDDIAPVLGEASYNSGYKDIENWLVRKKDLVITVPITEEGSGVDKIVYTLMPENGEIVTGEALMGEAYVPRQVRQAAVVQLDVAYGKINVDYVRTNVNDDTADGQNQSGATASQDTTEGKQPRATGGQVGTTDGQIQAKITLSEDYKGTVSLKCIDNAGNESADKLLTATGGGVIVEDNAPQISFVNKNLKNRKAVVTVSVSDDVDENKNSKITGGISSITYQVDDKQEQNVTAKNFDKEIVSSCEFNVDISGSGQHTLKVTAIDNAGNESQQTTNVIIAAPNKKTTVIKQSNSNPPAENKNEFVPLVKVEKPELPKDSEPATGDDSMRVEVYATIAMIAGLLYVLLYFITGQNGMTEDEKNETVSHLLAWAKKGGRCRKYAAIAAIFCVLFYYHSIGKCVDVEWNEVVSDN